MVLVGPGVPLEEVATASGVSLSTIEALNPQYLAGRTPPSQPGASKISWRVRVPAGRAIDAGKLLAQATDLETLEPYAVRFGETVESIALTRGTTEARIRSLNRVDPKEALAPGTFAGFNGAPYMYRLVDAQGEAVYRTDIFSRSQIGTGTIDPAEAPWPGTLEPMPCVVYNNLRCNGPGEVTKAQVNFARGFPSGARQ